MSDLPAIERTAFHLSELKVDDSPLAPKPPSFKSSLSKSEQEAVAQAVNPGLPILFPYHLSAQQLASFSDQLQKDFNIAGNPSLATNALYQQNNVAIAAHVLSSWGENLKQIGQQIKDEQFKNFHQVFNSFNEIYSRDSQQGQLPLNLTLLVITPFTAFVAPTDSSKSKIGAVQLTQQIALDPLAQAFKEEAPLASYLATFILTHAVQKTALSLASLMKKPSKELTPLAARAIARQILTLLENSQDNLLSHPLFLQKIDPKAKEALHTKLQLYLTCTALCLVYTSETKWMTSLEFLAMIEGKVQVSDQALQKLLVDKYLSLLSQLSPKEKEAVQQSFCSYIDQNPNFLSILAPIQTMKKIQELPSAQSWIRNMTRIKGGGVFLDLGERLNPLPKPLTAKG